VGVIVLLLSFQCNPFVPAQGSDTAVVRGFAFFGKETARHSFVMIPMMRHAVAAFAMSRAGIGTRTGSGVAAKVHLYTPPSRCFPLYSTVFLAKKKGNFLFFDGIRFFGTKPVFHGYF
jgi:hypothetical protein